MQITLIHWYFRLKYTLVLCCACLLHQTSVRQITSLPNKETYSMSNYLPTYILHKNNVLGTDTAFSEGVGPSFGRGHFLSGLRETAPLGPMTNNAADLRSCSYRVGRSKPPVFICVEMPLDTQQWWLPGEGSPVDCAPNKLQNDQFSPGSYRWLKVCVKKGR